MLESAVVWDVFYFLPVRRLSRSWSRSFKSVLSVGASGTGRFFFAALVSTARRDGDAARM
jgi:hypothetical protein